MRVRDDGGTSEPANEAPSATPQVSGSTPWLNSLVITPDRGPTTSIRVAAPTQQLTTGGSENPQFDCKSSFTALVDVNASHSGKIFFRQYILALTRKEHACGRKPMRVVKGPALDSQLVYNHGSSVPGCTGVIAVPGGETRTVTMTDFDSPAQVVDKPVCTFSANDTASLYASDLFRLLVMWEPTGGTATPLGHVEWSWRARGGFTKVGEGSWVHGASKDADGPNTASTVSRPGEEPATQEVIGNSTIMQGKEETDPF